MKVFSYYTAAELEISPRKCTTRKYIFSLFYVNPNFTCKITKLAKGRVCDLVSIPYLENVLRSLVTLTYSKHLYVHVCVCMFVCTPLGVMELHGRYADLGCV